MWISFCNWFVKITAWPAQKLILKTKFYYKDKSIQSRRIKGPAIIVSNHTSIYDYALYLFVFFSRTCRFQMAEVLFEKKFLGTFLKCMGGIYVNRKTHDFSFLNKSEQILKKGGVVGVFPESRIPLPEETRPLPFASSVGYLALMSGAPVIPVFTNGRYFTKDNARVIIGCPVYARDLVDPQLSDKENVERVTNLLRDQIIELGNELDVQTKISLS